MFGRRTVICRLTWRTPTGAMLGGPDISAANDASLAGESRLHIRKSRRAGKIFSTMARGAAVDAFLLAIMGMKSKLPLFECGYSLSLPGSRLLHRLEHPVFC
jgi:hypothetical protein